MPRLFISSNHQNSTVAEQLESALKRRGHVMTVSVDARPAGRWEEQLLRGLHTADACICLLTSEGMDSDWVISQTGIAISCAYTKQTLVLPVCPEGVVPNFVAAFHCFWLKGTGPTEIDALASELHEAIVAHRATRPPRIFISHRHKDKEVARKLIDLLESAFTIGRGDIRCTSVPGYKLPVGSQSAASLQSDLNGAEIVMGVIGPDTSESDYVLFELGASWGLGKPTFPLRLMGASYEHVPEVLREKSSLLLEDVSQCLQLVEDVGRISSLDRKPSAARGTSDAVKRRAEELARAAKPARRAAKPAKRAAKAGARAARKRRQRT